MMAFTTIKGTVTRTFFNGKGAEITETFQKRDGSEGSSRWTAWFESEHGLSEGEQVEASGMHSDEVDQWTDKQDQIRHSVKRSLNNTRIKAAIGSGRGTEGQPAAEQGQQGADVRSEVLGAQTGVQGNWSTSDYDEGVPF